MWQKECEMNNNILFLSTAYLSSLFSIWLGKAAKSSSNLMASRYPLLQDQCKAVLPYKHEQKSSTSVVGIVGYIVTFANSKYK